MNTDIVCSVVALHDVPDAISSIADMPDADYVDVSVLSTATATGWSAEDWARAILETAPSARRFAFLPWQVLLGLRLGPWPSPDHVHGWKIAGAGDDWIRLETASWLMTCHAVARVEDGRVSVGLFVRYDNPVAALWWPALSVVHRRAMPVILHQGDKVLQARPVAA
jgi:hypothetical protein